MKNTILLFLTAMCSSTLAQKPVTPPTVTKETKTITAKELDQDTVIWVYEAHAELPTSMEKLAGFVSADYSDAEDEFKRDELLQKIKPIIVKRIKKAKTYKTFFIKSNSKLSSYDFEREGFSSDISENTFYPKGGRYAVKLSSATGVDFFSIKKNEAKTLLKKLGDHRECVIEITGTIDEAKDIALNRYMRKTVIIIPTEIKLSTTKGIELLTQKIK